MNSNSINTPSLPHQKNFWDYWNLEYRNVDFEKLGDDSIHRGEKVIKLCKKLKLNNINIIEIGCGTGWLSSLLLKYGKVSGVDLSPKAIEKAKENVKAGKFISGDFFELDLKEKTYDLIICVETFFYVYNQEQFLEKINFLLKDDGYLILTCVNKYIFDRIKDVPPPGPGQIRSWMSRKEVKRMLQKYFKILRITTVLPTGNLGLLRIVNSHKLNSFLNKLLSKSKVMALKEFLGFGQSIIFLVRKKM